MAASAFAIALACRRSARRRSLSTSSLSSVAGGRRTGNEGPTEEGRSGGAKWWWLREISCFLAFIPAYVTVPHARASQALFPLRLKASIWPSAHLRMTLLISSLTHASRSQQRAGHTTASHGAVGANSCRRARSWHWLPA